MKTHSVKNKFKKGDKVLAASEKIQHFFGGQPAVVLWTKFVPYPEADFAVVYLAIGDKKFKLYASDLKHA